jgi:EthD domain
VPDDRLPDSSLARVAVLLASRGGCRGELAAAVREAAGAAAAVLAGRARVIVLVEIDEDPFPAANPLCRPFDAVLEVQGDAALGVAPMVDALRDLAPRLADVAHLDLSGCLIGAPQEIIPCEPTPLRYLYLMRRRAHTTRAEYFDYYFHHHARFGFATPNISGYTQLHVDPDASASAARRLGVGSTVVDSVSELHMESLPAFFAGIGDGRLGAEAGADEERFVDRANSVSFCTSSEVIGSNA